MKNTKLPKIKVNKNVHFVNLLKKKCDCQVNVTSTQDDPYLWRINKNDDPLTSAKYGLLLYSFKCSFNRNKYLNLADYNKHVFEWSQKKKMSWSSKSKIGAPK